MKYLVWLFILISSSVYASGIYTWVDEEGEIHYGDARPMSVHSEEIRVDVAPNNPGEPLPRLGTGDAESSAPDSTTPEPNTTASNTPDSAQPDSEMSDEQAAAICKQAHYERKVLNNSKRRSKVRTPDGGYRRMTLDERKSHRKQSDQDIAAYCK
jgi:hypothetical protein